RPLVVRLEGGDLEPERLAQLLEPRVDRRERHLAVELGFPPAEQIQIWPVEHPDLSGRARARHQRPPPRRPSHSWNADRFPETGPGAGAGGVASSAGPTSIEGPS